MQGLRAWQVPVFDWIIFDIQLHQRQIASRTVVNTLQLVDPNGRHYTILTSSIVMHSFTSAILPVLLFSLAISAESKDPKPCTIVSPVTEAYYDLNTIAVRPLIDHKPAHKDDKKESWHARGYDYGTNFTLNFCRPVIEDLQDVVGVHESHWQNVSAFYRYNDKIYSIGCVHVSRNFILIGFDILPPRYSRLVLMISHPIDSSHQSSSSEDGSWF